MLQDREVAERSEECTSNINGRARPHGIISSAALRNIESIQQTLSVFGSVRWLRIFRLVSSSSPVGLSSLSMPASTLTSHTIYAQTATLAETARGVREMSKELGQHISPCCSTTTNV